MHTLNRPLMAGDVAQHGRLLSTDAAIDGPRTEQHANQIDEPIRHD